MFKKSTYSDLEIQEIMQSLFLEKKKVKDLELKLKNCTLSPPVITPHQEENEFLRYEIESLQQQLQTAVAHSQQYKTKLDGAASPQEIEGLQSEISTLKRKLETSQELVQQLKSQSISPSKEIESLRLEISSLQKKNHEGTNLNQQFKETIAELREKLQKTQEASDKQLHQLKHSYEEEKKQNDLLLAEKTLENGEEHQLLRKAEEEISTLNKQITSLKDQLQKAQDPAPFKQKETQLENVIQFMRHRSEELQKENQELLKKLSGEEDKFKKLNIDLLTSQEALQKITHNLCHEKSQKEEIQAEEEALKGQLESLKTALIDTQENQSILLEEKRVALQQIKGKEEEILKAQREIELLKQMMMKTLQEFKEERILKERAYEDQIRQLKEERECHHNDQADLQRTFNDQKQINNALNQKIGTLEKDLQSSTSRVEELTLAHKELALFTEELKQKLVKADESKQGYLDTIQKTEELATNLNGQIAHLAKSLADAEEALVQIESDRNEHESRLRVAQQHLAKKVREASLLAEKNEELKLRQVELEESLGASKNKLLETLATLEAESQHQQKLHQQYQESLKSIESQGAKWEEKYFQIHERWQEAEARNRELRHMEERFSKLQQLLGNLGSLLGAPLSLPASSVMEVPIATQHKVDVEMAPPTPPCTTIQTTLFEASGATPRFKENLF